MKSIGLRTGQLAAGQAVVALEQITEDDFPEVGTTFVHAEPGDAGRVIRVEADGWVNVAFTRTGSVTVCQSREIRAL